MELDGSKSFSPKSFSVRDSDLPSLLSEAAVDIANKIYGERDDREAIIKLRKIFYDWQEQDYKGFAESSLFIDAIGIENFNSTKLKINHLNELPLKINLLAKELKNYENASMQSLEELRNFFVDLSRKIGDYQSDLYGKHRLVA